MALDNQGQVSAGEPREQTPEGLVAHFLQLQPEVCRMRAVRTTQEAWAEVEHRAHQDLGRLHR